MQNKKKAIVIGGGLGGLSCALTLKSQGFDVSIFEKNDHWGGKLNFKKIENYCFDLGPSILTMPHIFSRIFEQFGKEYE